MMRPTNKGLILDEIAPGWTVEAVQSITGAKLIIIEEVKEYEL